MAFFDNFTKKVTEATQSVAQKGKDFAETAKLSQALSEEEKRLEEHYKVIGKLFVETIGDKVEGEFAIYVANVRATEAKIAELKEQIKQLKGIINCVRCGAELSPNADFCNNCGERVPKPEPVQQPVYAQPVQQPIYAQQPVYTQPAQQPVYAQPVYEQPAQPEQPSAQPMADSGVCPKCGAKLMPGAMFCDTCGERLIAPEEAKPTDGNNCPKCGTPLQADAMFCGNCGEKIEQAPIDESQQDNKCSKCGAVVDSDATFCNTCGNKLK